MDVPTLTGNIGANVITVVLFLTMYVVREKCKHVRCACHTTCSDCLVRDDEFSENTITNEPERKIEEIV